MLTEGSDRHDAAALIAADPALLAEAERTLPAMRSVAIAPCGAEGVKRVIGRRFATFPQPSRSDGEWSAWWTDYVEALGDIPEGRLEAGMKAYLRSPDAEFMPKPGRLRDLAKASDWTSPQIEAATRAGLALRLPKPEPKREMVDPAKVQAMLAEVRAKFAQPANPA